MNEEIVNEQNDSYKTERGRKSWQKTWGIIKVKGRKMNVVYVTKLQNLNKFFFLSSFGNWYEEHNSKGPIRNWWILNERDHC